jgi:hypothetical protein
MAPTWCKISTMTSSLIFIFCFLSYHTTTLSVSLYMSEHKSGLALWELLKYREIEITSSTQCARHQ